MNTERERRARQTMCVLTTQCGCQIVHIAAAQWQQTFNSAKSAFNRTQTLHERMNCDIGDNRGKSEPFSYSSIILITDYFVWLRYKAKKEKSKR